VTLKRPWRCSQKTLTCSCRALGVDEARAGRAAMREQIERDFNRSDALSWTMLRQSISSAGSVAWTAGDVIIRVTMGGRTQDIPHRLTTVLECPEHPVRVRIGLHAGEPVREGNDFRRNGASRVWAASDIEALRQLGRLSQLSSCAWLYFVPEIPTLLQSAALQSDGTLPIRFLPNMTQEFLQTLLLRFAQIPKRP
jgi:SnoaL-like domain